MSTELALARGEPVTDRATWLAERRKGIGASEAAAALGCSPFETPHGLYLRKIGRWAEPEETEAMYWGSLLEPLLMREYIRRNKVSITASQLFLRGRERPYLLATLDAVNTDGVPVEFKTISSWKAKDVGEEGSDDLPDHWRIQAHQQMYVTGADRCDFAVLIGGQEFRTLRVERHEPLVASMLSGLENFWMCVELRTPPDWGEVAPDPKVLAALWPMGGGAVELDAAATKAAERFAQIGRLVGELHSERDACESLIRRSLGDAEVGLLPDGSRVKRYVREVPEMTRTTKAHRVDYVRVLPRKAK